MEVIAFDVDCFQLFLRDFTADMICIGVEFAMYPESVFCSRSTNEIHHHFVTDERLSSSVLSYEGEHVIFDFVPLTRSWGEMANGNRKAEFVGKVLKLHLPEPDSVAITTTSIGCDK